MPEEGILRCDVCGAISEPFGFKHPVGQVAAGWLREKVAVAVIVVCPNCYINIRPHIDAATDFVRDGAHPSAPPVLVVEAVVRGTRFGASPKLSHPPVSS